MTLEGELVLVDPTQSDPVASLVTLKPLADQATAFRVSKAPEAQLVGEDVVFELDAEGEAARSVTVGSCRFERVGQSRNRSSAHE